jgi:hypothetical protein
MNWYDNRMQASFAVNNVEPHNDHFITERGDIVTHFAKNDNLSLHISPEHAEALVEWAQSIYDTFVRNGFEYRMKTFGMFSSAGESMVRVAIKLLDADATVNDVILKAMDIAKSNNVSIPEINDTVVRENIHEALENARNSND